MTASSGEARASDKTNVTDTSDADAARARALAYIRKVRAKAKSRPASAPNRSVSASSLSSAGAGTKTEAEEPLDQTAKRQRNSGRPLSAHTTCGPSSLNAFHFPPRGFTLPTMSQIMSEPKLLTEHLAVEEIPDRQKHRAEFLDMLQQLDSQSAQRVSDHKNQVTSEIRNAKARADYKRSVRLEFKKLSEDRTPWTYPDPPDFFEKPMPGMLLEASNSFERNQLLQGMFVNPEHKAPHWQPDVKVGWAPHTKNERRLIQKNDNVSVFGGVPAHRASEKELMYQERVKNELAKAEGLGPQTPALEEKVAKDNKRAAVSHAEPWAWGRQTAHEIFMPFEPSKPGDNLYLDGQAGVQDHVVQPERALSYKRQIIIGKGERKDFWKEPDAGHIAGTAARAAKARLLIVPRGCPELREAALRAERETRRQRPASAANAPLSTSHSLSRAPARSKPRQNAGVSRHPSEHQVSRGGG